MEPDKQRVEEIKDYVKKSRLDIDKDEQTVGLECDCIDHDDENFIREGNRAYAIVISEDNGWNIRSVVCNRCSVRKVVERVVGSDKECVGIVETTVTADFSEGMMMLQSPKIWELMKV
jgi:hypothetical protein